MPEIFLGVPPSVANLIQRGLLQRAFHDALVPALLFRNEAEEEEWEANTGTEVICTRRGIITPKTTPLQPGVDPNPSASTYEQWYARLQRYGDAADVHLPTAAVASSNQFLSTIKDLGVSAGMSLNRVARNALFTAYLSGQTTMTDAAGAGDALIHVASLNGFTDVVVPSTTVRPVAVSATNPQTVTIGALGTFGVIGAVPDDANDPLGPGFLALDAALGGAGAAARTAVLAADRPTIIRAGGGLSVDALGLGDVVVLQDLIAAVTRLRKNNIPPHEDGYYHAHWPAEGNAQIFADQPFQRLNTALIGATYYQEAFVGRIGGCDSGMNNEAPEVENSGATTATSANALYSTDIKAETRNHSGINVGRIIVTGRGALQERWLDESKHYVSEAGVAGKQGQFQVVNGGVAIETKHIRLVLRAPVNRLLDLASIAWSVTTAFPVPTDIATGSPSRYKRAICVEYARD
jgi:hypothetical protein